MNSKIGNSIEHFKQVLITNKLEIFLGTCIVIGILAQFWIDADRQSRSAEYEKSIKPNNSINLQFIASIEELRSKYSQEYNGLSLYEQELNSFHKDLDQIKAHLHNFNKNSLNLKLTEIEKNFEEVISKKTLQLQKTFKASVSETIIQLNEVGTDYALLTTHRINEFLDFNRLTKNPYFRPELSVRIVQENENLEEIYSEVSTSPSMALPLANSRDSSQIPKQFKKRRNSISVVPYTSIQAAQDYARSSWEAMNPMQQRKLLEALTKLDQLDKTSIQIAHRILGILPNTNFDILDRLVYKYYSRNRNSNNNNNNDAAADFNSVSHSNLNFNQPDHLENYADNSWFNFYARFSNLDNNSNNDLTIEEDYMDNRNFMQSSINNNNIRSPSLLEPVIDK